MARPERTDLRARYSLLSGDLFSPVGLGALQAGVFWLLEEKILHKGRSGGNRGDRKIFGGKDECLQTAFV